jgi:outer membrane protein OmpA-like peptidoglycan-associated protein/tetratricopeptide (TPR) repeat protein
MSTGKATLFLLLLFVTRSFSQLEHADSYFHYMDYHQALPLYLKAMKKKKNAENIPLLVKIGDCYRFMKDYSNSARYYRMAIQKGTNDPDVFLHDGMILKSTGDYEEAEVQFNKCLELRPNDILALNGIRSCKEVKRWRTKPKEYDIINLSNINTIKSEFSPVIWKDQLIFVAERENDLINFSTYEFNGQPFLNVFASSLTDERGGKVTEFSRKLNTNFHDGPVCFSKDGNTIYYTRVKYHADRKNKEFVNRAKIYFSEMKGNDPKKEKMFSFDSDLYSIAHPSISADGNRLFFSSDKPGGFGGFDIYVSTKGESDWSEPVNLGPDVNTVGNEEFPFFRDDSVLFFSSDGLPGFGGLDIFSATEVDGKWILRRNEGIGINDITDDFGIFFVNNKTGFFSSDRAAGMGADDIYKFTFADKSQEVSGYILTALDTSNPAPEHKVLLLDSSGVVVAESRTDKKGFFKFENLDASKNYMVMMDENDPGFSDYPRYYYADKYGNLMKITKGNTKGNFVFTELPLRPNSLAELQAEDDFTLAGNVMLNNGNTNPLSNVKLVLKDDKGHVIDEVTTTETGAFVFRKLPAGTNYLIEMAGEDIDLPAGGKITITNKDGKELKTIEVDAKGKYELKILAQEKKFLEEMSADDKDLVMDLSGVALNPDKEILKGVKVFLLDELGNKIEETTTGPDGSFVFKNLPSNKNYLISMDVDDPSLSQYDKIYIADKKGNILRELQRLSEFKYHVLEYEKFTMAEMYVEDTWLVADGKTNVVSNNGKNGQQNNSNKQGTNGKNDGQQNIKNTEDSVVVVKNNAVKKDSVVSVKNNAVKKDSVVGVKNNAVKKDSVVGLKNNAVKKDSVVGLKNNAVKKDSVVVKNNPIKKDSVVVKYNGSKTITKKDSILFVYTSKYTSSTDFPIDECLARRYKEPEISPSDSVVDLAIVYFPYEKFSITDSASKVLNRLMQVAKSFKRYKIIIDAHADSRGSDDINLRFSKYRASKVASYFISKGIPGSRMIWRGNGEFQISNDCCNNVNCVEELHAQNRRAEVRIVVPKQK